VASTAAVCVVGALLVGGLLMANTGASPTASPASTATTTADVIAGPTTEAGETRTITRQRMAQTLSTIGPSIVALAITVGGRTVDSTAVTVGGGGIVVALASALASATSVATVDPDGHRTSAAVLASDPTSNLAILRVNGAPPVAQFSDAADLKPGDATVAVAPEPRADRTGVTDAVYAGTVRSSGTAVNADATTTAMSATTVNAPLNQGDAGCALINQAGDVAGIMDTTTTMNGRRVSVFLPADLVVGVAAQLMATGSVQHGWLGLDASVVTPRVQRSQRGQNDQHGSRPWRAGRHRPGRWGRRPGRHPGRRFHRGHRRSRGPVPRRPANPSLRRAAGGDGHRDLHQGWHPLHRRRRVGRRVADQLSAVAWIHDV
jgi:S1-C subfamily serine protease